ncbi:MAG TPA: SDR family oxidoreductase [Acidimicrobiales bacterium]|jgi:NAD(P)-dependent dehydrogenase (short-subunit alcohol dehydrogenase family)|nr:SDR family oxidoreductase [Acidimicrobiales bacterium]
MTVDGLFRLDGRRALVVGGYGGIGEPTVRLLRSQGAAVAIAGRSADKAAKLADEVGGVGLRLDITDKESIAAGVAQTIDALGGLDIVVNMAGTLIEAPALDFPDDAWDSVMTSNLTGAFWLSQAAAPALFESESGGRLIHFSSVRSLSGGRRGFAAYAAAKAGLNNLVRQLATEWGARGVTVNAVAPGFVRTDINAHAMEDENFMRMVLGRIPMGRMAEPMEVAGAVGWLASPAAAFVTGQIVFVDGGVTASQ